MKLSFVMIELRSSLMRKTILFNVTFIVIKDAKLLNKVEYPQNELKSLIEADKEKYYLEKNDESSDQY